MSKQEKVERQLRDAELTVELMDIPAVQDLLNELGGRVEAINDTLLNERNLNDVSRLRLLEQRDCWNWLGQRFQTAGQQKEKLTKRLEKYE